MLNNQAQRTQRHRQPGRVDSDTDLSGVTLTISIVVYRPDWDVLCDTLETLHVAVTQALACRLDSVTLHLVDNGADPAAFARLRDLVSRVWPNTEHCTWHAILSAANVGYGAGHNLVGNADESDYRLILNPDVMLEPDALVEALAFMRSHTEVGLLSPRAVDQFGRRQYLCKQYPAVLDLLLRGFMPAWIRKAFRKRLHRYEMRGVTEERPVESVPIASGCFMLIREWVWRRVGGFDPKFFLYFEDFDLSLRVGAVSTVIYHPCVRIRHLGGHSAKKGLHHIRLFARSALTFYAKHGWRWW